ncbi:MAG: hypothetical protein ISS48_04320 [Candidatus Aenigmarchaeota archaeon]|nr:hypothetical protein [Candidatus Aenigmarchaeota archaeon]
MKGLALETIGFVLIALIGVFLLIMFVSGSLNDLSRNVFCYFYQKVFSKNVEMCKPEETIPEQIALRPKDNEDLARQIAAYSILCWEKARKSLKTKDTNCYSLTIKSDATFGVSEIFLTEEILIKEGGCNRLENSEAKKSDCNLEAIPDKKCGENDYLFWDVGDVDSGDCSITDQKLILIKYDDANKQIVVKG